MNAWDKQAAIAIAYGDSFFWIESRAEAGLMDVKFTA